MHSATGEGENLSVSTSSVHPCRRFSLAEIQYATKDFDDELVIGQGGFGKVYKGQITIDHVVAIKRLDSMSTQGAPEFKAEIETLSKLRHCNLVSLIGYCDDSKEMILVYEYMPNGTLYHHLHKSETHLDWLQRMKIAIGGARGLDYLHTGVGSKHGIIHRDVKSSNILLDENWTALISDFGLSKIGPTNQSVSYVDASVKGTFGYLDPEYVYTTQLTRKTDVFAFGVVLFELLSGRLAVDVSRGEEQCSLVRWAQKCVKERKIDQIVDSKIKGTIFPKCLRRFALIADRCVHHVKKERPTMTEVVALLQALLELQQKYDSSANSGSMGFNWKIHKYLVSKTKQNSDQSGTSSPKILENNMNQVSLSSNKDDNDDGKMLHQHVELESTDVKMFTYEELERATTNYKYLVSKTKQNSDQSGTSSPKSLENNMNQVALSSNTDDNDDGKMLHQHVELESRDVKMFTYEELERATRNFCCYEYLGGIYGKTYDGWVDNTTYSPSEENIGLPIAVIELRSYKFFDLEWLKKFSHPNLVKLIGYCLKDIKLFLVYEFMSNMNFDHHLVAGRIGRIPWVTKVKIAIGIARAIDFLPNTKCDITTKNIWGLHIDSSQLYRGHILFDEDFTPKLSRYDITMLVYGGYPYFNDHPSFVLGENESDPGCEPLLLRSNLSGFTVIFTEVLTGKRISTQNRLYQISDQLTRLGGKSWRAIAESCFYNCNEVDSESKMVKKLKRYENYISQLK